MNSSDTCCEPSGVMVKALRDALAAHGSPIGAGMARVALMAALMAEHERVDNARAVREERSSPATCAHEFEDCSFGSACVKCGHTWQ
jgi:hypothetical protein